MRFPARPLIPILAAVTLLAASPALALDVERVDLPVPLPEVPEASVDVPLDGGDFPVPCDLTDLALGRIFPEPEVATHFIRYGEAKCGLEILAAAHPETVRWHTIGESQGWQSLLGGHDRFELWAVEVSNFESDTAFEDKPKIIFQLSIHGNEKGGREGGLRLIEDFARDTGRVAAEPEYKDLLDHVALVFLFPNPDGWVHEEPEYRANDACYLSATCIAGVTEAGDVGVEGMSYVRGNGNGVDLNREWPTRGWYNEPYRALSEPESQAIAHWLSNYTNVAYASDIHGMLNPADMTTDVPPERGHFVLSMMPAGKQDPVQMAKSTILAERVETRMNANAAYAAYQEVPNVGAWGGNFNSWGTVWDTIGYTDSGFTSDWWAQEHGLNAPGISFELAYNHMTFDNYYAGPAQLMNIMHVEATWDIVRAFMDQAAHDVSVHVDTGGTRTLVVENPTVITNAGDLNVTGWAAENPADDRWDIGHNVFRAAPHDYWEDVRVVLRDGDAAGVLDVAAAADVTASGLAGYDNLVIPGTAIRGVLADEARVDAVRDFVEAGGTLLLTDSALQLLPDLGVASAGAVQETGAYAGFTNFVDRGHPMVDGVRGLARQTYEPVALGFSIRDGGNNAPVWYVDAGGFNGEALGYAGQGGSSAPDESRVNFGQANVGEGRVVFLGALLPDPSTAFYHPYGLDSYATTYTGNQLVRNALGWTEVVEESPAFTGEAAEAAEAATGERRGFLGIPAAGVLAALGAAALAAVAVGRRRE